MPEKNLPSKTILLFMSFLFFLSITSHAGNVIVRNGQLNVSGGFYSDSATLYVDSENNRVGIGTTTPSAKLEIDYGELLIQGNESFASPGDNATVYLGDSNHYIRSTHSEGVRIGSYLVPDAFFIAQESGNIGIGIGTRIPDARLEVEDANGSAQLKLVGWGGNYLKLFSNGTGSYLDRSYQFKIDTDGDEGGLEVIPVVFRGNGNVGINTTSPLTQLDVNGGKLLVRGSSARLTLGMLGDNDPQSTLVWNLDNLAGDFRVFEEPNILTGGTVRLLIKSGTGNVGIGNFNPTSKLVVSGSESTENGFNSSIQLVNTASGGANWYLRAGATGTNTPAAGFSIGDDYAYRFVINGSGSVGIGTNDPSTRLHIKEPSASTNVDFKMESGSGKYWNMKVGYSSGNLYLSNTSAVGVYRVTFTPDGKVGIGTSSPLEKLDVAGSIAQPLNTGMFYNLYYDSGWKYRSNGYGGLIKLENDGDFIYQSASNNSGGAGASATVSTKLSLASDGDLYLSGDVGIGTTSPSAKLHVYRNSMVGDSSTIDNGMHIISHTKSVAYNTPTSILRIGNREGCFVGTVMAGFSDAGSAAVAKYDFYGYYGNSALSAVTDVARTGSDNITVTVSTSTDYHTFNVTQKNLNSGTESVTIGLVLTSCGKADSQHWTVDYY